MALPVPSGSVNKSSDICSKGYYILWTLFILQLISCASCLFEDQIGKFDWRQHYIGKLKYATFDAVASTKKIFVATEQNVIAALNPKSGHLIWRQVLEREDAGRIQHMQAGKELISISGGPYVYVRAWDLTAGFLLWEWTLSQQVSKDAKWLVDQKTLYHIVPLDDAFIEISVFNVASGADLVTRKLPAPWLNSQFSCAVAGTYYACVTTENIYWANIATAKHMEEKPLSELGFTVLHPSVESVGSSSVSVRTSDNARRIVSVGASGVSSLFDVHTEASLATTTFDSQPVLIELTNLESGDQVEVRVRSLESGADVLELSSSLPLSPELQATKYELQATMCSDKACRLLLTGDDHSVTLLHQPGKMMWTREEALASIVAVEMLDLPVSDMEAAIEKEFGNKEAGFVGMLWRRISSQVLQLRSTLLTVLGLASSLSSSQQATLVRDGFGLHKMIVAVSSAGKVFGIDNLSGEVLWQLRVPHLAPFTPEGQSAMLLLYVLRTSSFVPYPALCALIGPHKIDGTALGVVFNPMTGALVGVSELGYRVQTAVQLPNHDDDFVRGLILLDDKAQAHAFPMSSTGSALHAAASTFLFAADPRKGELVGYSLALSEKESLVSTPVWEVKLSHPQERVVTLASKNPAEKVHSQGRVLADRSVMYKYINPNLVAVVTQAYDPQHKYMLNVYLVDAVSGSMVFSASHKRARAPVHLVHSENWVVYSYYNDKSRRTEIATLELYEGKTQSNSTAFSSLSSLITPIVERQAFIMPAVIESMRETITEKGITSKHILLALSSGGILELPWMFVDPRRPVVATAEMRDEGVIPYVPELPVPPDAIINYNLTVQRVRGIHTAPSGLESTCLVLVYGLDLFYTRVAPSKTFDLLKDDFDHLLISAVLLALVIASYATKRLASRKALKQAWK